jgi:hypothetical protein
MQDGEKEKWIVDGQKHPQPQTSSFSAQSVHRTSINPQHTDEPEAPTKH